MFWLPNVKSARIVYRTVKTNMNAMIGQNVHRAALSKRGLRELKKRKGKRDKMIKLWLLKLMVIIEVGWIMFVAKIKGD